LFHVSGLNPVKDRNKISIFLTTISPCNGLSGGRHGKASTASMELMGSYGCLVFAQFIQEQSDRKFQQKTGIQNIDRITQG
jgi:hypothetical protein